MCPGHPFLLLFRFHQPRSNVSTNVCGNDSSYLNKKSDHQEFQITRIPSTPYVLTNFTLKDSK